MLFDRTAAYPPEQGEITMRLVIVTLTFVLLAFAVPSRGADGWGEVEAETLADGVHVLRARGGNIGVITGNDGAFLVDDQFAPLTARIRAKLDELAGTKNVPVRFVLNTHFHGDHTGGNENFGQAGAVLVAHDNVRARMTTGEFRRQYLERGGVNVEAALPVVTFNDGVTFHVNGRTLETRHFPHAHTDGDSVVWLREDNIVHMGDIYFQAGYPFIDIDNGGSVKGVIQAVDNVLARADANTKIIPGHGKTTSRQELVEYRDMLVALRDRVAEQLRAGKSLDDVRSMRLSKSWDERWSWDFISGERFVETLYRDLSRQREH
jgi:cyclase